MSSLTVISMNTNDVVFTQIGGGGYHSTWGWEGDYLEVSYTSRSKKIKIDSGVS